VYGVRVIYKMGSGLYDWIYWYLIHSTRNYRQFQHYRYSHTLQFTVTHALGFSVFTSRILATDFITALLALRITHEVFFSQPNSFLPLFCNDQFRYSTHFNSSAPKLISWQAGVSKLDSSLHWTASTELFFITTLHGPHRKHSLSIIGNAYLQRRCILTEVTICCLRISCRGKCV
jgi:hypothetical protein